MHPLIRPWFGVLCIGAATTALAILPNKTPPLPNYDRWAEKPNRAPAVSANAHAGATARLEERVPRAKVTRDDITGTPKLISSADGFLTGPNGQGKAVGPAGLRGLEQDRNRAIKAFLNEHSALFGQDSSLLNNARIKREFVTPHSGMRTVIWEQQVDGIPVFEGLLTGHVTKQEELVSLSSGFIPNGEAAANLGSGKLAAERAKPRLKATEAIAKAAAEVEVTVSTNEVVISNQSAAYRAPGLNGETEASLVWLPLDGTKLRLCWQIILTSRARGEMYRVLVDAEDGIPLLRHCLTSYISEATYRVHTSDSPSPFSPGHPTPLTNQPPLVARVLVTTSALNTNASPLGWINDGVNETRGNNVDAHLDRNADNAPDLPRPQGSPSRVFDFAMNLTQEPTTYGNASVVQLFYWNNWMHDKLYELGFTEAAGNFQLSNFGRGGVGNDAVNADAQDGSGFNNANFSTPPDGSPGRMQMYLFNSTTPDRDGDFDAEVVLHEYAHGLSNRRVGGGVGISTLQAAGMGEGWSDFYGLALLSESGDNLHGNYAAGGYLTFQLGGLLQNYYFGIRRYPYSTDMTRNPLTFKDIDPGQASTHPGIPISPIFGGSPADEVHNQGEVWCVTLWDARANLIEKHGFEAGNQLILQLVTDGMNLSPANPNFLQARDAIIQADRVLTGGANHNELWRAFAKRGMGFSATSPSSTTTSGVRESFDVPDDLLVLPTGELLVVGPVGGPFTPNAQTYSLTNVSTNNVVWSVTNSAPWLQVSNTSGALAPRDPAATMSVALNALADSLPMGIYTDQVRFTNHVSRRSQSRLVTLVVGQPDYFTEQFQGDNDLDFTTLTFAPDGSSSYYSMCRETAAAFPVDPREGKPLSLGDDTFISVRLAGSGRLSLYGRSTNQFFVGSNGYITLGAGDFSLSESLDVHFSLPRITALLTDLNPAAGGSVSWQQMTDRAVVTFLNVPLFGSSLNTNGFQMEMFYDGRIRITYLRISHTSGVAGLSRGEGLPVAFRESDLSGYPTCSARFLVSFPSSVMEGQGTVDGTVSLPIAPTSNVVAVLRSSNPSELMVPATVKIGAGETSAPFPATIVDDALLDGVQQVTITATKIGYSGHSATATVHDNEQSALTLTLPEALIEGFTPSSDLPPPGQGTVTAAQNVDADTVVSLSASDPSVQLPATVTISAGANTATFLISIADNLQIDGNRLATISASVENWMSATGTVEIVDDEQTRLVLNMPPTLSEQTGTAVQQAFVAIPGFLTSNLVVTLTSSDPSLLSVPPTVTITAGQLSNRFDITVNDNAAATGDQTVSVTSQVDGWEMDGAVLTIIDDETPPQPMQPVPAHLSSNNSVDVNLAWSIGDGELIENGSFETGDLTGWARNRPGAAGFTINDGMLDPSGPDGPLPPFAGNFNAVTVQTGPGRHELIQQVRLPGLPATLRWTHRMRNHAGIYTNVQNFRVEIRNFVDVLATAFTTQPDDTLLQDWTEHSFDLTPLGARTVEVVFVEEDNLGFFNAHVDEVSVIAVSPRVTVYDVYFGTSPTLGPSDLLGSTTNATWDLPRLAALTTYYWQIVARRTATTVGPVWQFTTRGVDHFEWAPILSPQEADAPFAATIVARDELGMPVTNFASTVFLSAISDGVTNPVSPAEINNFVAGEWSGEITVAEPSDSVVLLAADSEGHSGLSAPIRVIKRNDVSIAADAGPNPVMLQRMLEIRLIAHNTGPLAASSVVVSNVLPVTLSFVSASATQGSCSNAAGTIVCQLGTLTGGQSATITINATAISVGTAENLATITRGEVDGSDSNNATQHGITVLPAPLLDIAPASRIASEAGGSLLVAQVRLNEPTTVPVTLDFSTENGTAIAGADFVATNGTLMLPAGATNALIVVRLLNDVLDETDETFVLVLTNVVNAVPQQMRYTLTIVDDDPAPSVSVLDALISEGDAGFSEARFAVVLSQVSGVDIRVNYTNSAGSAMAGPDFITTNGTLTLPAGATNGEIIVAVRGDLLDENNETFNVNLFAPVNALLSDPLGVGTIADDDPRPSLRVLDASFIEGQLNSTQLVTVTLSAPSALTIIVSYGTSNGTAIAGTDFTTASGSLVFAPGTVTRTIPIRIMGDTNNETHETFSVLLSNVTSGVIADGEGLVRLVNDDAPPGTADYFTWNVVSSPQYINAPFAVTITARDYAGNVATNFTGTVALTANSTQSIPITPTTSSAFTAGVWSGDISVLEPATDVRLRASDSAAHTGESNPFDVTPTNDVALSMAAVPNPMTVGDTLRFAVVVTNTGPDAATGLVLSNTLPDNVQFVAATASHGTCSNSGNLVVCELGLLGGSTAITINVDVLTQVTGSVTNVAIIHRTEADAYAANNIASAVAQVLPEPTISIFNLAVVEADTNSVIAAFNISLSHPSSRVISMDFATIPGEAGSQDFVARTGRLMVPAGVTNPTIEVTVLGDLLDEANETFALELSNPANATLANSVAYASIQDQDAPPTISINDATVAEGNPPDSPVAEFTASLSRPSGLPIFVQFTTQGNTATAGTDYTGTNGVIEFAPGATDAQINVQVMSDFLDEADEIFLVNLLNPTNATLLDFRGSGTILDDDSMPAILVSDLSIVEGNSGFTTGIVQVALSHASGRTISVQYTLQDGMAAANSDFPAITGTLNFAAGTTNLSLTMRVFGDLDVEETEDFFINFYSPINATMPDPSIRVLIINDDGLPGDLASFSFAPIASPRRANTPFSATVFGRDYFEDIATSFAGSATLRARAGEPEVEIGSGAAPWHYPLGTFFHDARCQAIYLASELQRAQRIAGLALNVSAVPGQTLNTWTIRMKHTTRSNYLGVASWESGGWTTVYQRGELIGRPGWINFPFPTPFNYNGSNHLMIDFSFNNTAFSFDGECVSTITPQPRAFTFRSDSALGDPLTWTSAPAPLVHNRVPNIRLQPVSLPLPVTPATMGPFASGMWTGNVTVHVPGTNVQLIAEDSMGHIGLSARFDVRPANTPLILRIARSAGTVTLSWESIAGQPYRVDYNNTLDDSEWQPLAGTVVANGPVTMASDTFDENGQRFYRVVELP
jgi:uncharacterized repeat protein (TIGR01451 family)